MKLEMKLGLGVRGLNYRENFEWQNRHHHFGIMLSRLPPHLPLWLVRPNWVMVAELWWRCGTVTRTHMLSLLDLPNGRGCATRLCES